MYKNRGYRNNKIESEGKPFLMYISELTSKKL